VGDDRNTTLHRLLCPARVARPYRAALRWGRSWRGVRRGWDHPNRDLSRPPPPMSRRAEPCRQRGRRLTHPDRRDDRGQHRKAGQRIEPGFRVLAANSPMRALRCVGVRESMAFTHTPTSLRTPQRASFTRAHVRGKWGARGGRQFLATPLQRPGFPVRAGTRIGKRAFSRACAHM
jgi:hypothetical protein